MTLVGKLVSIGLTLVALTNLETVANAADPSGIPDIHDGDTLRLAGQRVRLYGIDAPEIDQTCLRADVRVHCGIESRDALIEHVGRQPVRCVPKDRDRYGRIVAICYMAGEDLNRWMVAQGQALAYRHYSKIYVPAEDDARKARRGLWGEEFTDPWDWRRQH